MMPDSQQPIDYKSAGVDIEAGNEAVRRMKAHVARTHSPRRAHRPRLLRHALLAHRRHQRHGRSRHGAEHRRRRHQNSRRRHGGRYENLGRDLVAAVAGDIAVMGARPLTFLDYLGLHKVDPAIVEELVRGMSAACAESKIALVGGETAEMPSVYAPGDLDVVGFVTGVVDRSRLLTGASITAGDVLYGVSSSGLHTNGWSLARKLLFELNKFDIHEPQRELNGETLADILLEPHANYVTPIRRALDAGIPIKGMAHITGGGLIENTPRILPAGPRRRHRPHGLETTRNLHVDAKARPHPRRRDASRLQHGHRPRRHRSRRLSLRTRQSLRPFLRL